MTNKLKRSVRARARKTGESYTAARRQVLAARAKAARPAPPVPKAASAAPAKGAVSDARVRALTGHGLEHWFDVLDRFGAAEKGHMATARHLNQDHGVAGWYAQGITVAYERARGLRAPNQRRAGDFEVSVSKVVAAPVAVVAAAFARARSREQWLGTSAPDLLRALEAGLAAPRSKGVRVRDRGDARARWSADGVTVELHVIPKPNGRTSVTLSTTKLADASAVETHRAAWRQALSALKAHLA